MMKLIKIIAVLLFYCISLNSFAFGKSPVWKISKSGNHLFIGGTIHVLTQSDYPLPKIFETAYDNSKILVLETDIQKFSTSEYQHTILEKTIYKDEQNITQFLKSDVIHSLKTYLWQRDIPMESLIKLKPGMLSIFLTVIELQRIGLNGTGVDEFFNLKAIKEEKKIKHLETVDDQLEFIATMGIGNENAFIEYFLNDLKNLSKTFKSMKKAWRNGDNAQLQIVALEPWKNHFPKIYNSLLVERNNNWIPQIEEMLSTDEVEFILFGAAHLVGEDGIIEKLKASGCIVENL
jgi:uncharacterized protein